MKPMNLSIVSYDAHLVGLAEGNPTPIYRWIHLETNKSADGSVLVVNGTVTCTSDKVHTFQCTVANIFGAESKMSKSGKDWQITSRRFYFISSVLLQS